MEGLSQYEKENRPWGSFERFALNEKNTVKLITVNPGEEFSLQSHQHRSEFWRIISGSGTCTLGDAVKAVTAGENIFVSEGQKHRLAGGSEGITFLEISFGEFDENDIQRFEDKYGRV